MSAVPYPLFAPAKAPERELWSVDNYMRQVRRYLELDGTTVERMGNQLMVYPRAVND